MSPESKRPALPSLVVQLAFKAVPLSLVMLLKLTVVVTTGKVVTMLKSSVTNRPPASVRVMRTVVVPAAVGVPLKVPVVALKLSQLGSAVPSAKVAVKLAVSPLAVLSTSAKLLAMLNGVRALPTMAALFASCTTTVGASLAPCTVTAKLAVLLPVLSVAV